jgi:hypothetical protein
MKGILKDVTLDLMNIFQGLKPIVVNEMPEKQAEGILFLPREIALSGKSFNTESLLNTGWFKIKEALDAYWSSIIEYHGEEVVVLNDYGDEDEVLNRLMIGCFPVYTLCVVHQDDILCTDLYHDYIESRMKFGYSLFGKFKRPPSTQELAGKRGFYTRPFYELDLGTGISKHEIETRAETVQCEYFDWYGEENEAVSHEILQ